MGRGLRIGFAAQTKPAWIDTAIANGWAVNTWAQISGDSPSHGLSATNTVDDVKPADAGSFGSNDAVMNGYSGGAFATGVGTYGSLIVYGGGHGDYYGNEVYAFDVDSRSWSRLTDPYSNPVYPNSSGIWPSEGTQINGSPGVAHTYDMVQYHASRNSFFCFKCQTNDSPSTSIPLPAEFNFDNGYWSFGTQATKDINAQGFSAYDSIRDVFVLHDGGGGAFEIGVYDPTADTWTYVLPNSGSAGLGVGDSCAAYDPVNDFILCNRYDTSASLGINTSDLSADVVTLTTSGKPGDGFGTAIEYCATLSGFLWYSSGANVYLVTKGAGSWDAATWTWTNLTDAGNTVTPEDMEANSVYSRFRVATHGDYTIAYTVKRTGATGTGAVYAFLLSAP